jgi:hypothetical protein
MSNFITRFLGLDASKTIESIGNVIDTIDKSDEKLSLQLKFKELLIGIQEKFVAYESTLLEKQSEVVLAEAKGESWLQRNWRPMLMLLCMYIVLNNYVFVPYFSLPMVVLDDHIWTLMEMGVTGYVAGRSLEKISENIGGVLVNPNRRNRRIRRK